MKFNSKFYDRIINDFGLKDISTEKQQKNGTIVFQGYRKRFGDKELLFFSVHKNGYIRRGAIGESLAYAQIKKFPPETSYDEKFEFLYNYLSRNYNK